MTERRRFKQLAPLQDRLSAWAKETRAKANELEPGPSRDALLLKVEHRTATGRFSRVTGTRGLRLTRGDWSGAPRRGRLS